MIDFKKLNITRIGLHILFWIVVMGYFAIFYGYPDNIVESFSNNIYSFLFYIFNVYFTLYVLVPRFLIKERYLIFIVLVILITTVIVLIERYIVFTIIFPEWGKEVNFLELRRLLIYLFYNYSILAAAILIKFVKIWYKNKIEANELEKKQIETELKLKQAELTILKAQIHPHFLFNTLNNLYGLTLNKSDKAPEVVIKISELLDYILYECSTPKVKLTNELKHIKNYIGLEEIRYNKKLKIDYTENGIDETFEVAPLLFLPFIENSFKHGASEMVSGAWIKIYFNVNVKKLSFKVVNSINANKDSNILNYEDGIGLNNVKKRLELLYKNKYELNINIDKSIFSVNLDIEL